MKTEQEIKDEIKSIENDIDKNMKSLIGSLENRKEKHVRLRSYQDILNWVLGE